MGRAVTVAMVTGVSERLAVCILRVCAVVNHTDAIRLAGCLLLGHW